MEEQNNQNFENQEPELETKEVKPNPKKPIPKMAIIIGAAVAVVAIVLVLIFVVFKHEHTWSEQTCTQGVYCTECNEIKLMYGYGHAYDEWIETSNCTSNGIRERTCKLCGEKETETIYARGYHNFSNWSTTTEANCSQAGLEERTCSDCGEKETRSLSKKDYHRYDNYVCLDCGDRTLVYISTPSMPMNVTNMGYTGGTTIIEKYTINKINVSIISWNLDGTCTVEISMDAEKIYESQKGYYMTDEISIEITNSNEETIHKAISLSKKSITLVIDASLSYYISIDETNIYV